MRTEKEIKRRIKETEEILKEKDLKYSTFVAYRCVIYTTLHYCCILSFRGIRWLAQRLHNWQN